MGDYQFGYGRALELLEQGKQVARLGWNGKDAWITLITGWTCKADSIGDTTGIEPAPFIAMVTQDKKIVPWVCSQTDGLATDWVEVEDVAA